MRQISGVGVAGTVMGMTNTLRAVNALAQGQVIGHPVVEIVLPICNEQAALEAIVRRVHAFAAAALWVPWRITIADNASTDGSTAIAVGSRLAHGARVTRGLKREVISRCYNRILRGVLRVRFTDAQCGFKAIRADVAAQLLPLVEDESWFFDTELLVLAERAGLRIYEIPVDWVDDLDSRVGIFATATADLRGVGRMWRQLARRPVRRRLKAIGAAPLRPVPMSAAADRPVLTPAA